MTSAHVADAPMSSMVCTATSWIACSADEQQSLTTVVCKPALLASNAVLRTVKLVATPVSRVLKIG